MSKQGTVSGYEHLDLLRELWESGLREKGILQYIEENNLPPISGKALAKYGQRNWNYKEKTDLESALQEAKSLGTVNRITVSKTGYSFSVTPHSAEDEEDIRKLPKVSRIASKASNAKSGTTTHVIIPDTQVEPGRPTEHLGWAGQYIKDNIGPDAKIIHLGDHWNMGSLSSYDRGKGTMEGRRYIADIEAGNEAFEILDNPLALFNEKHFLLGNHENRVNRTINSDIQLQGLLTTDHMDTKDWIRHDFLDIVDIDGISYSHYFYNPTTSKPYGGELDGRLKIIGRSFVMGHQQGLKFATRYIGGKQQIGLAAGSFYLHEEDYMGPQGTGYWRGIIVLHDVEDGSCESPEFISIKKLERMYG